MLALQPLAGELASTLFGIGLIGAAVLAAAILPLSTAYSVCEYAGTEAALNDSFRTARTFYVTFGLVTLLGAVVVMAPGVPLVTILVATQILNAVEEKQLEGELTTREAAIAWVKETYAL